MFGIIFQSVFFIHAEGYGQVMLSRIRQAKKKSLFKPVEFPLTFGRDFAGQIVAIGANVTAKDLNVGDAVMGVTAPFQPGCHAEFVTVPETQVKPSWPCVYTYTYGDQTYSFS